MIELLARWFIPHRDNTADGAVRRAYGTLCGAVGIGLNVLLFIGKFFAGQLSGSIAVTADAFNNLSDAGSSAVTLLGFRLAGKKPDPDHPFGHGRIEYISGLIVAGLILLMGVDEQVKQDANGIYGNANQSDVNILAVLDLRNKEMTLISVSRDAMCTLDILDSAGEHVGTATAQLALAYAYGDGAERSCELTSAAVSRLFYDLPIPAYGSIYMQGIRQLVDSVGGVTVTPGTSIPGFAAGQPVTLTGKLTENYIRYRADSTEGNNQRMQRQKQVVLALVHKMLAQVKEDPASILALYNNIRRNTTTNINTAMMVYLAQQASGMHFSDDIVNVPGTSVMGAQRHAEYQVDQDALLRMILNIFYEPVDG